MRQDVRRAAAGQEAANITEQTAETAGRGHGFFRGQERNLHVDQVLGAVHKEPEGGDEEAVKATVKKTIETFGRIDVLINNAQASKSGVLLENHTKEDFDLAIYSGLYATFFFMRECFPSLKETKGAVINFASGAGLFGRVAQSSYAAAKEGIRGLSRVAATEWAPYGVNVNIVCPLAMTSELEHFKANYPDAYNATLKGVPMGRFGDPEKDIGRVCVFLGSEDAKYMSGETLTLQGGSGQRP